VPSTISILGGFDINRKTDYIYNSRPSPGLLYIMASILKYIVYLQPYILNNSISIYRGILVEYDSNISKDRLLIYRIEAYYIW
jgi:hypothetical protein